jgi:hypothetical protein
LCAIVHISILEMWSTPEIVLALFALGGAGATMLMFLAASSSPSSKFRARPYGQVPLSRRYANDEAVRLTAAKAMQL